MGLFNSLFGKHPEKHEQKGDAFFKNGSWGPAKLEYEKALDALTRTAPDDQSTAVRLQEKLVRSKNELASEHRDTAVTLLEQGDVDDAEDLLRLALELSRDAELTGAVQACLDEITPRAVSVKVLEGPGGGWPADPDDDVPAGPDDEQFSALIGTLPEAVQTAYASYGESFRRGYLSLNRGQFELAAEQLSLALSEQADPASFVPLELATALVNLARFDEARRLLSSFVETHPDALPAYQLLCEIYWETGAHEKAHALLDGCPASLRDSLAFSLLRGETLARAGNHEDAIGFYRAFMAKYGWIDAAGKAMALSLESVGDLNSARNIYAEIMNRCRSCHARTDPYVKRKLADVSFELGHYSTPVLEMYLSLAQEDPQNLAFYFERVGAIYEATGSPAEADRYRSFARQAELERTEKG